MSINMDTELQGKQTAHPFHLSALLGPGASLLAMSSQHDVVIYRYLC